MPKKLTQEDFINRANNIHNSKYNYSEVNFIKLANRVTIVCPIHGEFQQIANGHLIGQGCPICAGTKKSNTQEFIEKAKLIHDDKFDYSKTVYINSRSNVIIICPIHGEFEQTPDGHLQGRGCIKCGNIIVGNALRSNIDKFITKAKEVHGNKYDYSKTNYTGINNKVIITCPIHGDFEQEAYSHTVGKGCWECGKINIGNHHRYTVEEFIEKANKQHNNKYTYGYVDYINNKSKVKIICPVHGDFEQAPHHHLAGVGCPVCCMSKGEVRLTSILLKHDIPFETQYTLPFHKFKYDFYLPYQNVFIEYHGGQHYFPVEWFGGEDSYQLQKQRDIFKKVLAREYRIPLLEFNYKQMDNLPEEEFESLVLNIINNAKYIL